MNQTDLTKIIFKIQYQIGKLEVIEFMYLNGKNYEPSLEMEIAYNMISTLRQKLITDSEVFLNASTDRLQLNVVSLQKTLLSVNNFLIQMSQGLNSTERQVIFLKELFSSIILELTNLSNELNIMLQYSSISNKIDSTSNKIDELLKNLKCKCLGDLEKVERLIQYENKKSPQSSREELIQYAITRWENDNR